MALAEDTKTAIQTAYSQWIASNEFKPRPGQRLMIALIAKALGAVKLDEKGLRDESFADHVCLIEAGTGTGKTVAYSIASILLAQALDKKLIISTATITLQEQLVLRDLPDLQASSGIDFSFAIAKGRQRYLCMSKVAMRLKDADASAKDIPMFPDEESRIPAETVDEIRQLGEAFEVRHWDGDRDNWDENIDFEVWSLIAADRASCSGKKCPYYQQCALFKARDKVRLADVVVANHDLVLADLATGGGNVLPEPEQSIYVFDEAHHLPSKSQSHLSRQMSLSAERRRITSTQRIVARAGKEFGSASEFASISKQISQIDEALDACLLGLQPLIEDIYRHNAELTNSNGELRFEHGAVPEPMSIGLDELAQCYALKNRNLQKLADLVLAQFTEQQDTAQAAREAIYAGIGELIVSGESTQAVCQDYADADPATAIPAARWLRQSADEFSDIALCTAPLSTAATLMDLVWTRCFAAVLTSATLAALGSFDHYIKQIGIGSADLSYKILGDLNFPASYFHVPRMTSDPAHADEHTDEIIQLLPSLIAKESGSLVLFSSRRQLDAVYQGLDSELKSRTRVQGERSKQLLIQKHKEAIDAGEQSILFGLASFSEGLDLPGDYCTEVIIAKLPFAVPDSPIDEAMGEWVERYGGNAFWDISVPLVSLRLLQACGRLLRNEADQGRVTLLDTRIVKKRYGKQLLAALPPFQLDIQT